MGQSARSSESPFQRVTHGRHCKCAACAREDWTNPDLACCGMHGEDCPALYQPWGRAGDYVDPANVGRATAPYSFTVEVTQRFHITRELPYEGHPDFLDSEAAAEAITNYIEAHHGDLPPDASVDYATVSAETESWHVR